MKKYLCLSLCLGIMVSGCRLDILQELDDANAKRAGGTQTDKARLMTSLTKQKVLEACLPLINTSLSEHYVKYFQPAWTRHRMYPVALGERQFFLRTSDKINNTGTAASPIVILYTSAGMPLEYYPWIGLGVDPAAEMAKMAASPVIQKQFIARENNAPGWRVHISTQQPGTSLGDTSRVVIPEAKAGEAPVSPFSGLIIYDPEAIAAANVEAPAVESYVLYAYGNSSTVLHNDHQARWYDCVVDEKTEQVTLEETRTNPM